MTRPFAVALSGLLLLASPAPESPLDFRVQGAATNLRAPAGRRSLILAGGESRPGRGHLLALPIPETAAEPVEIDLSRRRWDSAAAVEAAGPGALAAGAAGRRTAAGQLFYVGRHLVGAARAPSILGDIVADPLVLAPPGRLAALRQDEHGYVAFARELAARRPIVAVAAGDGLVHGFDESSGAEAFAFAPEGARGPLTGALAYDDVWLDGRWRTLLAGTSAPGRGIYVLDVTRPDGVAPPRGDTAPECLGGTAPGCSGPYPRLLWQRAEEVSTAAPAFARLRLPGGEHSALLFGSGGALQVVEAATGKPVARLAEGTQPNGARRRFGAITGGVSVVDLDGDGFSDSAYFGDSEGQLWKLPLAGGPPYPPQLLFAPPAATPERTVSRAPSVQELGADPRLGTPILGISWVEGSAGRGRVRFLLEGTSAGPVPFRIESPSAPRLGTCGGDGPPRLEGWQAELAPGDRALGRPLAIAGYVFLSTLDAARGAAHLYRLFSLNGDPCRGADCCGEGGRWSADRAAALQPAGWRAVSATGLVLYLDGRGEARAGVAATLRGGAPENGRTVFWSVSAGRRER